MRQFFEQELRGTPWTLALPKTADQNIDSLLQLVRSMGTDSSQILDSAATTCDKDELSCRQDQGAAATCAKTRRTTNLAPSGSRGLPCQLSDLSIVAVGLENSATAM
jgi:hypothetical protein